MENHSLAKLIDGPTHHPMLISVVIPVYRSRESLPILVSGLIAQRPRLGAKLEIVMVDDCSPPGTWEVLKTLQAAHPEEVQIARLAKNAGQHNAILYGFQLARGEVVVTMDDDLQNPPEEVAKLVAAIRSGYDVAIASYDRKKHSAARNLGGALIDSVLRHLFHLPRDFQLTSFRAISRPVIDAVNQMGGLFPYVTAMLLANASHQVNIPVRHDARPYGNSNYNFRNSLGLAANLIFSYSSLPVAFVGALCLFCMLVSLGIGTWSLIRGLILGTGVPGWASLMVTLSLMNALILMSLAIFGIYLSRVSRQLAQPKHRFIVAETRITHHGEPLASDASPQ